MKKVYIPIIIIIVVAFVFTSIKWQVANSQLQECKTEVGYLASEVGRLQVVTGQQQTEIERGFSPSFLFKQYSSRTANVEN